MNTNGHQSNRINHPVVALMLRRGWYRVLFVLFALCAVPVSAHAQSPGSSQQNPFTCPASGTVFHNATSQASTFFLYPLFASSATVTIKWSPPSRAPVSTQPTSGVALPINLKAGSSITYSCTGTGVGGFDWGTSLTITSNSGPGKSFVCPSGTFLEAVAGPTFNGLLNVGNGTLVPLTISFTGTPGLSSVVIQPGSNFNATITLGPSAKITYSCPGSTADNITFVLFPQSMFTAPE